MTLCCAWMKAKESESLHFQISGDKRKMIQWQSGFSGRWKYLQKTEEPRDYWNESNESNESNYHRKEYWIDKIFSEQTDRNLQSSLWSLPGRQTEVGKQTEYLNRGDKEAREKVKMFGGTDSWTVGCDRKMKMQNQMEWMRRMNNVRDVAEEVVLLEIIYV